MKVIIDIPKKDYDKMCKGELINTILVAIKNGTLIPDNATNGDIIMALFPNYTIQINSICESVSVYYEGTEEHPGSWFRFDLNWWNAPYTKEVEE